LGRQTLGALICFVWMRARQSAVAAEVAGEYFWRWLRNSPCWKGKNKPLMVLKDKEMP
jgi:hypothetical protein